MTAIVDLVKKTKTNMIDLEILTDQPSDNENDNDNEPSLLTRNSDDSFSDHLGLIEDLL
eukprot:UN07823